MQFLGTLHVEFGTVVGLTETFSYSYTQDVATAVLIYTNTVAADAPTAFTFNGASMTLVYSFTFGSGRTHQLWKYFPPASLPTGSYSIVATFPTTGRLLDAYVGEYSGIKDDFTNRTNQTSAFTSSPLTTTFTLVANDSWMLVLARLTAFARQFNGSTDGVSRNGTSTRGWCDSGASEGAAGSKTTNFTSASGASGNFERIVVELKRETNYTIGFTEAASTTDIIPARSETRNVTENETFLDYLARTASRALTETATFTDNLVAQAVKLYTDVASFTDVLGRVITKGPKELFVATDRIVRTLTVRFRDTSVFLDDPTLSGVWIPRIMPSTSWSDASHPSSAWSNRTKPTTAFTPTSHPSSAWTPRTKPPTTWS